MEQNHKIWILDCKIISLLKNKETKELQDNPNKS